MKFEARMMQCDGDAGWCPNETIDHFEAGASTVDGTRVTSQERSPGWLSIGIEDFCPVHKDGVTDDE